MGVAEELLQVRVGNLTAGMSLARQYDTLRQPGKSRLRTLRTELDAAVLGAYGFLTDDDLLTQLFALNLGHRGRTRARARTWADVN